MTCQQVQHDLDAYLDRELDGETTRAMHDHVSDCPTCRRVVAEREAVIRLVRAAPYYSAPAHLRARVVAPSIQVRASRSDLGSGGRAGGLDRRWHGPRAIRRSAKRCHRGRSGHQPCALPDGEPPV